MSLKDRPSRRLPFTLHFYGVTSKKRLGVLLMMMSLSQDGMSSTTLKVDELTGIDGDDEVESDDIEEIKRLANKASAHASLHRSLFVFSVRHSQWF